MNDVTQLDLLEAESIHILREVAAEFGNPVLLYLIDKDSLVLFQLLLKAFEQILLRYNNWAMQLG